MPHVLLSRIELERCIYVVRRRRTKTEPPSHHRCTDRIHTVVSRKPLEEPVMSPESRDSRRSYQPPSSTVIQTVLANLILCQPRLGVVRASLRRMAYEKIIGTRAFNTINNRKTPFSVLLVETNPLPPGRFVIHFQYWLSYEYGLCERPGVQRCLDYRRSFGGRGLRDVWASNADCVRRGCRDASCLFMLELNFHCESSIYSSQWFACLASHTSRSNSTITHPSFPSPFRSIGDNLSCGELLKGEVLGSSNAKRINNLPVDVEAVPPTVRG
ncbi:hypothetical protein DY000_02004555 [Brassica cretica]|uniref:Uncharacterized protein n=1 Tax=Brassica cretica TaxID=69181 RepID=A0ABQ7BTK8_BRACR|nr:hypothetical protein DY000_02004555 [Brassica cretica]